MRPLARQILVFSLIIFLSASLAPAQSEFSILIVFDSSSRMSREVNGQSKFQHAVQFVQDLVDANIPANLGLTVFGSDETGGSEAYFSPVPPGRNTGSQIMDALSKLSPSGLSPMASALDYAGRSFPANTVNLIVLVTDGLENTGGGPITVIETLMNRGIVSQVDVVGFGDNPDQNPLIGELIRVGNGRYTPAWGSDNLIRGYFDLASSQLVQNQTGTAGYRCFIGSVNSFPAYGSTVEIRNSTGQSFGSQSFWRGIFESLVPGQYTLTASHQDTSTTLSFEVIPGERTEMNFVFNVATGAFTYKHMIENTVNGMAYGTITRVFHSSGETVFTGTSSEGIVSDLPEGTYTVEALFEGLPLQSKDVEVIRGTQPEVEFQFNIGRGRIAYQCFLDQLKTIAASGTTIRIFRQPYNELALEESQWRGTTTYLPIGLYTVEGNYKGIVRREDIEVHSDSTSTLDFTFSIAQVRFSFQCFSSEAKKVPATGVIFQVYNQAGALIEESNRWRGNFQLPEGIYSIQAHFEGKTKTQTLNLFASGQQTMIVIDFEK